MLFIQNSSIKFKGFTLVELMVSIVISSIIMLGVVSLYSSSRKGQKINESLSRIQENLRYAADMISRDVRMAGYSGCKSTSSTNAVNTGSLPTFAFQHITGFENGATFPSPYPAIGTASGNRIANTDAMAISRVSSTGFSISIHQANSAKIIIDNDPVIFEDGDMLTITDCNHSATCQVSQAQSAHIVHNTGVGTPGNCWKKLGPVATTAPSCSASNGTAFTFGDNAHVHKNILHGYYIGVSSSGKTKSLYIIDLDKGISTATELVEGVEDFQITYGFDTDDDGLAERYLKASQITVSDNIDSAASKANWLKVVSVKFGMLLASINDAKSLDAATAKSYSLVDTSVTPTADKKLRFAYNTTVKIRNKGIR